MCTIYVAAGAATSGPLFRDLFLSLLKYKTPKFLSVIALFAIIATRTPLLKDLHYHITPHYAVHWRAIGTLLDLPSGTLDIIKLV